MRSRPIALLLLLGALAACSGGGDSTSADSRAENGNPGPGPLLYTGNTNPAFITASNGAQLTASVQGSGEVSSAVSSVGQPAGGNGALELGRRLNRSVRATPSLSRLNALRPLTSAVSIDTTEPCADGGSVHLLGSINQDGTGTLSISWSDCRKGDDTLTGRATIRVEAFDEAADTITDSTVSFDRLTLRGPGASAELSGTVRDQVNIAARTEAVTANFVIVDGRGRMVKAENLVFSHVFDDMVAPTSFVESVSGRIFDGSYGFVDIATNTPLVFETLTQAFPSSGQIVLTGAQNGHIRVTALSRVAAKIELDLDGNDSYERTAFIAWSELAGPAGADLADNDGDGMHNSWESAKGLNPFSALDKDADSDADGASNLAEYRAGTHPNDATSLPPITALRP